jgi:hypothetical protein
VGRAVCASTRWQYVIEIVESIVAGVDLSDAATRERYGEFVAANPAFMTLTHQRATSYWDVYYRGRFPVRRPRDSDRWETYPAFVLLNDLATLAADDRRELSA